MTRRLSLAETRNAAADCEALRQIEPDLVLIPEGEAEWEKAARGPANLAFGHGDVQDPAKANVLASRHGGPIAVGSYAPNGYGLFDTDGNVAEWVADSHAEGYHQRVPARDPKGPPESLEKLMKGDSCRGGTFASYCWAAGRADASHDSVGFRVACDA